MRSILRYKYIFLLVIISIITIIVVINRFPSYSPVYIIAIGIAIAVLGAIVVQGIQSVLDSKPMLPIQTYSDYEKSVQAIDEFLRWLIESEQVCDLVTLYVRDEMDKKEFNIIANQGLWDSSPMYGPLVFDDFRLRPGKVDIECSYEPIIPTQDENPKGFRARENILSRASFKLPDNNKNSLATLYLNWRNKQEFTVKKKEELDKYVKEILSAVEKIDGISIKRQMSNNAELRVRRWIDYHGTEKRYKDHNELIFESIYRFFEDIDRSMFRIEIWRPDSDNFTMKKKDYMRPHYDIPYPHRSDSNDDESDIRWVIETTRPKFLSNSLDHK